MKRLYGILLALAGALPVLLLAGAVLSCYDRMPWLVKKQPIAYNHKTHIAQGLECGFCHTGIAEGKARAGLPALDVCLGCHDSSDSNAKSKPLQAYAAEKRPVPWKRVYQVPDNTYFSHWRHVSIAKLDCAVCHGDVAGKETPVTRQAVPISMSRCMDCHRRRGVANDCLRCHR